MGGDVNRERTSSNQQTLSNAFTYTPGTNFGNSVLGTIDGAGISNEIQNTRPWEGDRTVAPTDLGAGNYTAQWGQTPLTFVPQRTATDAPTQVTRTNVDQFYQPGIDMGLADATANRDALDPMVQNLRQYWGNIVAGGGQNPYLEPVIDSFTQDFNEQSDRARGQRALYAGAEGAFGGTPFNQNEAWSAEQEAQAFGSTVSGLRYQDFLNTQGLINQAPGQLGAVSDLATQGADQVLNYGNMQQANLQHAAETGDYNAQVLMNNLHQAQQLNDENAMRAAQEAIAQWNAQHQSEEARVSDLGQQTATQQQIAQTNLDNQRQQYESYQQQIQQRMAMLADLLGLSRIVPGASTSTSGIATGSTDTRANASEGFGWDDFSGLLSAVMGGISSDRRVKKNLEHVRTDSRGVKWYLFHYVWQSDNDLKAHGVIAQELQEIAPQFVINNNGLLAVDYDGLNNWSEVHGLVSAS